MRDRLLPAAMLVILAATSPALAGEKAGPLSVSSPAPVRLAAADGPRTASVAPGTREARLAPLPQPLAATDAGIYRRALDLQARGDWAGAERELAGVGDDLLVALLQARRPSAAGRSANGRAGRGFDRIPARGIELDADGAMWEQTAFDTDESSPRVRALKSKLRQSLRDGGTGRAEAILASGEMQGLGPLDQDRLRLMVATDHFAGGRDDRAASLAAEVAERSGERLPAAHWVAGLSLWRAGKPDQARRHFEEVANHADGQDWMTAAGAFWAGRANLLSRRPEAVNHWMEVAAAYPRTFYGLLARAWLGYPVSFSWDQSPFTEDDAALLLRIPAARRGLALLQLGETDAAAGELAGLAQTATRPVGQALAALAQSAKLPGLTLALDADDRSQRDAVSYPLPEWVPQGGWRIDRALVLALARQESSFNPAARAPSGAAGLMQLMPSTARAVGGPTAHVRLTDPAVNLSLGQRYIARLLDDDPVNGNLMMMAAAYNAGPGTLGRWLQGIRHGEDPLLFVESLPARETRVFVQQVLSSYWIYQARLGQPQTSLETLAAGNWPVYGEEPAATPLRLSANDR